MLGRCRGFGLRRPPKRLPRWALCGVMGGGVWIVDFLTDHSPRRFCRAMGVVIQVALLYKYATPETPEAYLQLHRRAAQLILNLCLANEGFYIKLGQGLNSMSHVLPREFTDTLRVLLDQAGPVPFPAIRRCIQEETGKAIEELFEGFEEKPVASASIAQVHRAWIRGMDGSGALQEVAVKVQRPCIRRQAPWDLAAFQLMSFAAQYLFGLPTEWARKTIVDGLQSELDFTQEAANATLFRDNFSNDKRIYIPKVYDRFTTSRLMVMEWVDATKLLDIDAIRAQFCEKAVLKVLFESFSDMVFKYKLFHSDPHAANVLVRYRPRNGSIRNPDVGNMRTEPQAPRRNRKDIQIVLLDFGLCVPISERFRMQYALLFKSFIEHDIETIRNVVREWGVSDEKTFLTLHMQKPLTLIPKGPNGEVSKEEIAIIRREAHARIKGLLTDDSKLPYELPMVARGLDILRGNNRMYGSPINYVKVMARGTLNCLGPIHDHKGVQRYLQHVHQLTMERCVSQDRQKSWAKEAGIVEKYDESYDHSTKSKFTSVYTEESKQLRSVQSIVLHELDLEHKASLCLYLSSMLGSLYQSIKFYTILLRLDLIHRITQWYNTCLTAVAPARATGQLKIPTLDELIDDMQTVN
ncbi:unnamed protein product [Phytomonas sp. Hart1]|nr:unnamed protein product [Phytomonas sp. Hart1]|eukprot:CCW66226.1 unnamed protein product [Phytomonas sp. isolate Hart1]